MPGLAASASEQADPQFMATEDRPCGPERRMRGDVPRVPETIRERLSGKVAVGSACAVRGCVIDARSRIFVHPVSSVTDIMINP